MARASHHIRKDDAIGPAGNRNAVERKRMADELLAGAIHRTDSRAACQDEGAVDIKENEFPDRVHRGIDLQSRFRRIVEHEALESVDRRSGGGFLVPYRSRSSA